MVITNNNINIKYFFTDEEDCISKVKAGASLYTEKEISRLIPIGLNSSISSFVLDFFSSCYDNLGQVYLPDQIDPEAVTTYIEQEKRPEIEHDLLLSLVCIKQRKAINRLYREMKTTEGVNIKLPHYLKDGFDFKKVRDTYYKLYMNRKMDNPKLIRCN